MTFDYVKIMSILMSLRVLVELAIPCDEPGPQVFQGFTVGFHPRSWELVSSSTILTFAHSSVCLMRVCINPGIKLAGTPNSVLIGLS